MKYLIIVFILLIFTACSTKETTINKEICESYKATDTNTLAKKCQVYDEKAAAKASLPSQVDACLKCLNKKGYELQ